jgi:hypothetical protein
MGLMSLIVFPLLLIFRTRINKVFFGYVGLFIIILLSGFVNHSSVLEIVLFFRILIFSYLVYWLVELYLRPSTITKVAKLCIIIAVIQLPIVLLQQALYSHLPSFVTWKSNETDFDFGTFNFKGDATMSLFLTLMVIFLLFDTKAKLYTKYKWLIVGWLTVTVFIAHSKIMQLGILLVWGVYLLNHLSIKQMVYGVIVALLIVSVLLAAGVLETTFHLLMESLLEIQNTDAGKESAFLSGRYGRGAAIAYYIERGILWLGDGPSKYQDVFTRTRFIGNTGHIFTFYSEIGLLGWFMSIAIFFFMGFPRHRIFRYGWVNLLSFIVLQLLSITSNVMNDIGIVMIYCIITRLYMLPKSSNSESQVKK